MERMRLKRRRVEEGGRLVEPIGTERDGGWSHERKRAKMVGRKRENGRDAVGAAMDAGDYCAW